MLTDMSRGITRALIESSVISFDEFPSYQFGIELVLISIFELIGVLALSFVFGRVLEALVFIMAFSSLRILAGGYHSKTVFRCFMTFALLMGMAIYLTAVVNLTQSPWFSVAVGLLAFIIFYWKAPVAVASRPISETERLKFRALTLKVSFMYVMALVLFTALHINPWYTGIFAYGMLFEAFTLIIEYYKEGVKHERNYIENC